MPPKESQQIREDKRDLVIPMRWVDTDKNDGKFTDDGTPKPLLAKSRLVVIGFRDKLLGCYRRDAPTASRMAEAMLLALAAIFGMTLALGDVKNAYFNGRRLQREVYLEQPRGGLPGLRPGQLLKAKKAIYGFAEAARLFWLALLESFVSSGWVQSLLEPALFTMRRAGQLIAMAVTHVDDVLLARMPKLDISDVMGQSGQDFQWTWTEKKFTFRGREIEEDSDGFKVGMKQYASSIKGVKIPRDRRKQLEDPLTEQEARELWRCAGEIGWIARQGRLDLAQISGELQRASGSPCVADLVRCNLAVADAKKGMDVTLRYPRTLKASTLAVGAAVDAGHANGPENDEVQRYRSCGGHVILLAAKDILDDKVAPIAVMDWKTGMTQRVCRSTLAAEASHLADAVEAVDWCAVLLQEMLKGKVDLKNWQSVAATTPRFWATDCKSVYDYLTKEGTSKSKDKRMAIEGALLKETLRSASTTLRWIDGSQNIADVLTKMGVDKTYLFKVQREAVWCLVQDRAAAAGKARKQVQRSVRKADGAAAKEETKRLARHLRARQMSAIEEEP
jgi:hypothetical protein